MVIIIMGFTVAIGAWFEFSSPYNKTKLEVATLLPTRKAIPNFELIDTNHKPFTQNNFRNHWNLLFFGYADCPDVCPATLSLIKDTWQKLPPNAIQFIFASINSTTDNVSHLEKFLKKFNKNFLGLTGTKLEMQNLSKPLGIYAAANNNDKTIIDHTSSLMLINPKGELHAIISPPYTSQQLAHDLLILIK